MNLVIIEGAGKKGTIEKYLGSGYTVFATKGHVRDLPVRFLAIDINNGFAPKYVIMDDKKETVESLTKLAKKADKIFLATDPDREGEAISWHLCHILNIEPSEPVRIVFNEISKKAVLKALENPRAIDVNLVNAQQARRVLDRLVGYKLSPVLNKKIQPKLSAGRVQSATLRMVVEREREIENFKPEEYWTFFAILNHASRDFKAALSTFENKKIKLKSKEEVDKVVDGTKDKPYVVTAVKKSVSRTRAPAPFITSTMQQDALNKLGMSLKQTSASAQALYEGVDLGTEGKTALITYIRTDSTRVSPEAQREAKDFILQNYGEKYAPEKFNFFASKKGAQDAHEAIRPIALERKPSDVKAYLSIQQYKLYKLIYERFLASQMSDAQYNCVNVDIECGSYGFKASGRTLLFDGFTVVYNAFVDKSPNDDDDDSNALLPEMQSGDCPKFVKNDFTQKFTKPPARFSEASLVKMMEERGIGRPATYVPTIAVLFSRNYVEKDGKTIKPLELGYKVCDLLVKYFPDIIDVKFTAGMEDELDKIEDGGVLWNGVIDNFYNGFEDKIKTAMGDDYTLKVPDEPSDYVCDKCGMPMVVKSGRFGKFIACSGFPKCKNILGDAKPKAEKAATPPKAEAAAEEAMICDKCGAPMVERKGRYGNFYGCSGYPACKNIVNIKKNKKSDDKK